MANVSIVTPATEAVNASLIDPGIKKYFFEEYNMLAPKLEKVFKVETMDGAYEDESNYVGLTDIPIVREGQNYTEDSVAHTYDTRYTAIKRGVIIPVTEELWMDQRAKVAGQVKSIARSFARTIEKVSASVLNNAFNTSYTSYGDAKPLCSTIHPLAVTGGTQSNASATSIPLTESNLAVGILAMRTQTDDRGNLMEVIPDTLVVPPALEAQAIIITKSTNRSGTANNDVNVNALREYTGGQLKVVVWDYIGAAAGGSDSAWFLMDSRQAKLMWKWRVRTEIKQLPEANGAENDVMKWKGKFRAAYGWSNWVAVWGSQGTNAAYSS